MTATDPRTIKTIRCIDCRDGFTVESPVPLPDTVEEDPNGWRRLLYAHPYCPTCYQRRMARTRT